MLVDVVRVEVLDHRRLRLAFDDGVEGVVDIASLVSFEGILALLRDPEMFTQVRVDDELGTIVWPNGADFDPGVLREHVARSGG